MFCREQGKLLSGEWLHNGIPTGVISSEYSIINADFSHTGEYQCRRNGVDVFTLELIVYGECSVQVKVVVNVHVCAVLVCT